MFGSDLLKFKISVFFWRKISISVLNNQYFLLYLNSTNVIKHPYNTPTLIFYYIGNQINYKNMFYNIF